MTFTCWCGFRSPKGGIQNHCRGCGHHTPVSRARCLGCGEKLRFGDVGDVVETVVPKVVA